jgi:hypothetical protein
MTKFLCFIRLGVVTIPRRIVRAKYSIYCLAVSTAVAAIFGAAGEARAQVDPNLQARLNTLTIPLILSPDFTAPGGSSSVGGAGAAIAGNDAKRRQVGNEKGGACISTLGYVLGLYNTSYYKNDRSYKNDLQRYGHEVFPEATKPEDLITKLKDLKTLQDKKDHKPEIPLSDKEKTQLEEGNVRAARLLNKALEALRLILEKNRMTLLEVQSDGSIKYYEVQSDGSIKYHEENAPDFKKTLPSISSTDQLKINLCKDQQPLTVKFSFPFNPTDESNVLKSNENIHADRSLGFGGTVQVISGASKDRPYDLIGFSVQSASARYQNFPSKSLDSLIMQGAYQFFLGAYGYRYEDGQPSELPPKPKRDFDMPPPGLITVDTLTLAIQNQIAYTPPFRLETADLLTPQVTLSRQNWSLAGGDRSNVCEGAIPDFKKNGFCYYTNLSVTAGQTSSDQPTLENANLAVSAALGKRFNETDWKLELQTVVTGRDYENVPGGRHDLFLQIGPNLTYQHTEPETDKSLGQITTTFSLPVTYYQNYSTISKDAWQGWIVMPTLTLAFQPLPKPD